MKPHTHSDDFYTTKTWKEPRARLDGLSCLVWGGIALFLMCFWWTVLCLLFGTD